MGKATVQIQYESEKLSLLIRYWDEGKLSDGLDAYLQTMYEQHVPTGVRNFIDKKEKGEVV